MEYSLLEIDKVSDWAGTLSGSMAVSILLMGDRIRCCDEGVVARKDGHVVGVATIASRGEEDSGQPTIVAVYVLPNHRRQGIGRELLRRAIQRGIERGFDKLRVDVLGNYMMKAIAGLSKEERDRLEVVDLSFGMDSLD